MSVAWDSHFRPVATSTLPIFRQDHATYTLFYAPGYLAVVEAEQVATFAENLVSPAPVRWPAVAELRRRAAAAQKAWEDALNEPFKPVCLTLYLNNECNLNCQYCFSESTHRPTARLSISAVRAAADIVAANCHAQRRPLTVVFHGGGEPTLHQPHVDAILDMLEQVAEQHDLEMFRYIATNGAMSRSKARWMAERFDLIGLSCDGPESIQAAQRPMSGGRSSTPLVERTAQIVRDRGKPLHVRVTITPQSVRHQTEIAEYLCQQIKPSEIHIEPVYQVGRANTREYHAHIQSATFVAEFLRGRSVAQRYGVQWRTSGSRPREVHGPYCQVLRDVLLLVPADVATACFTTTTASQARERSLVIGEPDTAGQFVIDHARIQDLRQAVSMDPPPCAACFNRYHCVRGCPEYCPIDGSLPASSFRCQVQQHLVNAYLQDAAATLCAKGIQGGVAGAEVDA